MRTTLNIDDELLKEAKIAAVRRNSTLTAVIEDGLRKELGVEPSAREQGRRVLELPAHIDPSDRQAVLEYLQHVGSDFSELKALGPFPTRHGKPLREFDWADSSALLEELEGPLARP